MNSKNPIEAEVGVARQELAWVFTPADGNSIPAAPIVTNIQTLPLHGIGWRNFERLCVRLGQRQEDAGHCQAYGVPGQEQQGIDLYIRQRSNGRYAVWQCKCYESLIASDIRAVVDEFLNGDWPAQTDVFCLVTSADLSKTELADEEKVQAARLRALKIEFIPIDLNSLSARLKPHHDLIYDFFGLEYVKGFCGAEAAAQLEPKRKLNPAQATELRSKLRQLYTQQFQSIDPGLPTIVSTRMGEKAPLTLSRRYIPLDVFERREMMSARTSRPRRGDSEASSQITATPAGEPQNQGRVNKEEFMTRRPLFQSLVQLSKVLIIGEPGSGKSATLRFLLLDLLADAPSQAQLAAKWGDRLPVWVPFAAWTRMVANQRPQHALRDVLQEWLHNIGAPQAAINLVLSALEDERLLLFVDGLDEWSNETSAATVLSLLNTFVQAANVPVVATARPLGFGRLAAGLGAWDIIELAGLDEAQKMDFARSWFDFYLGGENDIPQTVSVSGQRTKQFLAELRRDNAISRISEIPLLLSGLIGLSLSGWQLPRSRFLAYEELMKLLVETHPALRKAATMGHVETLPLSVDETYRALAKLAFLIQESPGAVAVPKETARQAIIEHLKERFGSVRPDIAEKADALLQVGADNIGILVEKTNDDLGFFHRIIQEFLAARHLHFRPLGEQRVLVEQKVADVKWHEVLLCLCHLTRREDEVDGFVNLIESANLKSFEAFQRERLLADIAFGDLHATPLKAQQLAARAFHHIENHWWMPLRSALLNTAIDGLSSPALREVVLDKLREWFPDPVSYRSSIYDILGAWPYEAATVEVMMRGLRQDDDWTQKPAAFALAKYARGRSEVGVELLALAKSPVVSDTASACLICLSSGWPSLEGVVALLEEATRSRSISLKLAGYIGLVNVGRRDESIRDALLASANADAVGLYRWENEIAQALLAGWPGDEHIKKIAIDSMSQPYPNRKKLLLGVAGKILVDGYPQDDGIAGLFAARIASGQGFNFGGAGSGWEYLARNFSEHPLIVASVNPWLDKKELIFGFDLYYAAMCTRAPSLKRELILRLAKPETDAFWIVEALIDAWGTEDQEVAAALKEFASNSTIDDSLGDTILRLPLEPEEQKHRLLVALRGENLGRRFSVIQGLGQLNADLKTDEVVDAAIQASQRPVWQEAGSERSAVILQFPSNQKVRDFALAELRQRNSQIGAVATAYGNEPRIRELVRKSLGQLPTGLRLQIVGRLESIAALDEAALEILSDYDADSDQGVKVAASCAYFAGLRSRQGATPELISSTKATLGAIGHDCWERRRAALLGLAALGRLDVAVSAVETLSPTPALMRFEGGLEINFEVTKRLSAAWPALMDAFGTSVWERVNVAHSLIGEMLEFVDDEKTFDVLAQRWEQSQNSEKGTPTALRALARRQPNSQKIRALCLARLTADNQQSWWGNVAESIAAAEIIAQEFGGDTELQPILEKKAESESLITFIAIALCAGWPDSKLLEKIADSNRPRPWFLPSEMHIACWGLRSEELLAGIHKVLAGLEGDIWDFFPHTSQPIVARFSKDAAIRSLASKRIMQGGSSDEKASLLKIISRSGGLDPGLNTWAQEELGRQINSRGLAELGCDLPGAAVRPVAHSILDVLEGKA